MRSLDDARDRAASGQRRPHDAARRHQILRERAVTAFALFTIAGMIAFVLAGIGLQVVR